MILCVSVLKKKTNITVVLEGNRLWVILKGTDNILSCVFLLYSIDFHSTQHFALNNEACHMTK